MWINTIVSNYFHWKNKETWILLVSELTKLLIVGQSSTQVINLDPSTQSKSQLNYYKFTDIRMTNVSFTASCFLFGYFWPSNPWVINERTIIERIIIDVFIIATSFYRMVQLSNL